MGIQFDENLNSFHPRLKAGFHGDAVGTPITWFLDDEIADKYGKSGLQKLVDDPVTLDRLSNHSVLCILTEFGLRDAFESSANPNTNQIIEAIHLRYLRWSKAHHYSKDPKPEIPYPNVLDTWIHTKSLEFADSSLYTLLSQDTVGQQAANDYETNCPMMRIAPIGIHFANDPMRAFDLGMSIASLTHGSSDTQFCTAGFAMLIALLESGKPLNSAVEETLYRLYETPASRSIFEQIIERKLIRYKLIIDEFNDFDWPFGYGWGAIEALSITLTIVLSYKSSNAKLIEAVSHNGDSAALAVLVGQIISIK